MHTATQHTESHAAPGTIKVFVPKKMDTGPLHIGEASKLPVMHPNGMPVHAETLVPGERYFAVYLGAHWMLLANIRGTYRGNTFQAVQ